MLKALGIFATGVVVSCFYFPFAFTFAPSVNMKMILAVFGLVLMGLEVINTRKYEIRKEYLVSAFIAALYSVINLVTIEVNDTLDYSYANYITTYFVWVFGAIAVVAMIRKMHGQVTIRLLTLYLSVVCAAQCIIAIIIDRNDMVKLFVDRWIFQGAHFLNEVNRLYGIGASLDPAGTRFAVVLIMIGFVLVLDEEVKRNKLQNITLLLCYGIMATLGNMMSRTTTVGLLLSFLPFVLHSGLHRLMIKGDNLMSYRIFASVAILGTALMIYLYNTDQFFHEQLRYGFEGFFSWVEQGEWKTDSTEKLNTAMWIWPEDLRGWLIGYGTFGFFSFSTDIGYCRLILYSGLVGFITFSSLFVYCAFFFARKYRRYKYMFIVLLSLSFLIWVKVATDLFFIYALFLAFEDEREKWLGSGREANIEVLEAA